MHVSSSVERPTKTNKHNNINPATKGALFTAGVLGSSSAISWIKQPQEMRDVVIKSGGKTKYALKYAGLFSLCALAGAGISAGLNAIANAVKPEYPPKAN